MWIITRNEHQALAKDDTWTGRHNLDALRTFETHAAAKGWIEQESVPEDFVWIAHLRALVTEQFRRSEKERKRERKQLRHCQYVSLGRTEKFYRSPEADDDWGFPVFDTFEATHAVMSEGMVIGVVGMTPSEQMPFYCYTFDEFYFAFEDCYTRRQPNRERHDFRVEGF